MVYEEVCDCGHLFAAHVSPSGCRIRGCNCSRSEAQLRAAQRYSFRYPDDTTVREPLHCECCQYPAPLRSFTRHDPENKPYECLLCEICSTTHIGTIHEYQGSYAGSETYFATALGWIANHLLSAIKEGGAK